MRWHPLVASIFATLLVAGCGRDLPTGVPGDGLAASPGFLASTDAPTNARAVTGSGHYTTAAGSLRTLSFHVRRMPDGRVQGSFQLVGHQKPLQRWHGPLTCFSVVGNEAWIGGFYEKSTNPALLGTGFGFYVKDNGEGNEAEPDLVRRHVRGMSDPGEWCASMPDVSGSEFLFPIEAGNIRIHAR